MSVMPPNGNIKAAPKTKRKIKPAEKQQKDIIRFVEGKVPKGLGHNKAKTTIRAYKDDPEKATKLKEYEDIQEAKWEAEYQKDLLKETFQENVSCIQSEINEAPADYGLKRVSLKLVKEACLHFEKTGRADFHKNDFCFHTDATVKIAYQIMQSYPDKIHYEGYTPYHLEDYTDEKLCNDPIKQGTPVYNDTTKVTDYPSVEVWETSKKSKPKAKTLVKNTPQSFGQRIPQPDKWAAEKQQQKIISTQLHPKKRTFFNWIMLGIKIWVNFSVWVILIALLLGLFGAYD